MRRFNEDTGEIARDSTGAHDGAIFGATWTMEDKKAPLPQAMGRAATIAP